MLSVKISTPTGNCIMYYANPAKVEYTDNFIRITDRYGRVCGYSYSHLIEVEELPAEKGEVKA